MADPFIGEVRIFAGNFAPKGWALCNGQLLPIPQNTALFALIGAVYGGDGKTNFALPDLRGRAPMHQGAGPGLSPRQLGVAGGSATASLSVSQLAVHNHGAGCVTDQADSPNAAGAVWANTGGGKGGGSPVGYQAAANTPMNPLALASTGGGQGHNNMQPYQGINFIIALQGIFPPRP